MPRSAPHLPDNTFSRLAMVLFRSPIGKGTDPVDRHTLTYGLTRRAGPIIAKAPRTSHDLRAFYVTVRRSQGIPDAQIAAEIGDRMGAAIIASTYGAIPPNWRGGPQIDFLPTKQEKAWSRWGSALI